MECRACPFECGVDRTQELGVCRASDCVEVSTAQLHFWEEPPISGTRGSGTVFFSHCNLRCRFCQNYRISQQGSGRPVTAGELATMMLDLAGQGAHNVNLVSPTHYSEQLIPVLEQVRPRLGVPVVWNSNGYEKAATLRRLEGLVQVYLPDFKYWSGDLAARCSSAPDYARHASAAIAEMVRQTGPNRYAGDGTILSGVIIRHLILPGHVDDTRQVLDAIARIVGTDVPVSLMAQYYPVHRAAELAGMDRRLTAREYEAACDHLAALGFAAGFTQDLSSASSDYTPDFPGS